MPKRAEADLVAYLDGELTPAERREVEAWLAADPAARDRLLQLAQTDALVRRAFDEALQEPVPERLLAAARRDADAPVAPAAQILPFKPVAARRTAPPAWRRWAALPAAASLFGLLLGGGAGYLGLARAPAGGADKPAAVQQAASNGWLDNAAGYYKLTVDAGDLAQIEVPATGDPSAALQKISQTLAQQVRLPNLKPWGLDFRGARLIVVDGRPAAQLVYNTDNKAIGPLTLTIGSSTKPDLAPSVDRRQDVNVLYWRHQGHAYALVGRANLGYLWGIANDVAWQLDAI
jgi:anti-sigma factor RsiW